jgi:hypothetical protein
MVIRHRLGLGDLDMIAGFCGYGEGRPPQRNTEEDQNPYDFNQRERFLSVAQNAGRGHLVHRLGIEFAGRSARATCFD